MNWKRIGRDAICLLVVCCLIFNLSPIKAKAVALEVSLAVGLIAALIAGTSGVVFVLENTRQIQALGQSFQTYMYQWGTSAEKLDEVEEWFSGLKLYDPSGGNDDDDDWVSPNDRKVNLARGILAGISAWCASIILGNTKIEVTEDVAPEGYMYYGDILLPDLPSSWNYESYPRILITRALHEDGSTTYNLYGYSVDDGYYYSSGSLIADSTFYARWHTQEGDGWYLRAEASGMPVSISIDDFVYANYDIYDTAANLVIPAMVPSSVPVIAPSTYVGDIPDQIQDGTLEEGAIELPSFDYNVFTQSGQPLQEAVTGTLHDLSTGALSYEQFLEQIAAEPVPDADPEPEPEPEPDPDPDTDPSFAPFEWLADTILSGIRAIFVPSTDFLTEKVDALTARFAFADSIVRTGQALYDGLSGVTTEPPVIYIDLDASEGSYDIGGKVAFLDLRWYAAYKPTVDKIISSFLWACFIWRMLLKLPGIINGAAGTVSILSSSGSKEDL